MSVLVNKTGKNVSVAGTSPSIMMKPWHMDNLNVINTHNDGTNVWTEDPAAASVYLHLLQLLANTP